MKKNLHGERVVEIPWLLSKLGKPKRILDIGSAYAHYLEELVETGAEEVWAIDTRSMKVPPGIQALRICVSEMPEEWTDRFDLVTCISTLDHIGLEGYHNKAKVGLLERSVEEILRVTAPGGRLLLTVPVGRDYVTNDGFQRVFGLRALVALFPQPFWDCLEIRFWCLIPRKGYKEISCFSAIRYVEYATRRAGACAAIELQKRYQVS